MAVSGERVSVLRYLLVGLVVSSCLTPLLAASFEGLHQQGQAEERKFVSKPNDIKKIRNNIEKQGGPSSPEHQSGFQWGNLAGMALKLLVGGPTKSGASDKADTITQLAEWYIRSGLLSSLQNGELTWTKMISLIMELVLSLVGGGDNNSIDRQDVSPSPIENILSAVIAYLTGSQDPTEVNVMARQASELLGLVVSLLDALRTSFSQRSMEARSLGTSDTPADFGVVTTSMSKGFLKTYGTSDELCMQRHVCEANNECVEGTSDSGYLYCQVATYAMSYFLEKTTYTPFEIYNDAGRRGRVGEDCYTIFTGCNEI